jgi:hypothetical protein
MMPPRHRVVNATAARIAMRIPRTGAFALPRDIVAQSISTERNH